MLTKVSITLGLYENVKMKESIFGVQKIHVVEEERSRAFK